MADGETKGVADLDYLCGRPAPQRTREEVFELMDRIREKTRGTTGVDDEISRLREDPRG